MIKSKAKSSFGNKSKSSFGNKAKSKDKEATQKKRATTLDSALKQIEKNFGVGSIMTLSPDQIVSVPGISTGALSLDVALGGRGLPKGRIIELYGPEGSGKTTLALHAIASAQKGDGVAAFIDAEHALDPTWARKLGA